MGGGLGQNEMGSDGLGVSGCLDGMRGTLPSVMGNIHSQQISVMGFINRALQAGPEALAALEAMSKLNPNTHKRGFVMSLSSL